MSDDKHSLPPITNVLDELRCKGVGRKLSVEQLACALYEGTPHLVNLAEKLARQHGKAGALTFYDMMSRDVQKFWKHIAQQLIDHAKEWGQNEGSGCCLSDRERARLKRLPYRVEAPNVSEASESDADKDATSG